MRIQRTGSQPSARAPAANFRGTVRQDMRFNMDEPGRARGAFVTFEPGARTNWHTHPLGQILIITAGLGWVQSDGGPVEEVRPGDIITFAAGEKHWHGGTDTTAMTHIAIGEVVEGRSADWLEPVTDEQFLSGRRA
jgi:quercetin dioxygenase-like cupin family protein